jgi:hypothetical protein
VAESEWPGEELPPKERSVIAALVLKGWQYKYGDENRLSLTAPNGDHWRVKRDDLALPVWEKRDDDAARRSLEEMLLKLAPPTVDLTDKTRRPGFSLGQVRSLIRQGYSARQVVDMTGWGAYWYADLVGPDGYYHGEREKGTA